jgi:hypothetical protein
MGCCGKLRTTVSPETAVSSAAPRYTPASFTAAAASVKQPSAAPPDPTAAVTLRCRHRGSTVVQGPITGKRYSFSGGGSMQAVDRRDAEALLASGFFDRVWG